MARQTVMEEVVRKLAQVITKETRQKTYVELVALP